jgi:hypothetical protein
MTKVTVPDIEKFTLPAEIIKIGEASAGNPDVLEALQQGLRNDEERGWCHVVYMDDDVAIVQRLDDEPMVITITDPSTRALLGLPPIDQMGD